MKECFTLANKRVDAVDHFTYLGVTFSYTGSFNHAIKDMTTKAMKASFKISATLKSRDVLDSELYTKLFDAMVKPVALYGTQIWSDHLLSFFLKDDFGNFDRLPFEQLHNKMCKCALRVGKYTSNLASRAELGRFPLLISIAQAVISYWINILASPDKLVYNAYLEERDADKSGQKNGATLVRAILTRCNLEGLWNNQRVGNAKKVIIQVGSELKNQFKATIFEQLQSENGKDGRSGNKLRTYKTIKETYNTEQYLLMKNMPAHVKRAITRIRLSAHSLEIERGRKAKPQSIPACERFCRQCKTRVEDEVHFIVECPLYSQLRTEMLRKCPDAYMELGNQALFKALFTSNDDNVLQQLGIFVCRAMCKRNCLLYDS